MTIIQYEERFFDGVVALWTECFSYPAPHNNPAGSIRRKVDMNDGLFFVSIDDQGTVSGSVMAGWDGHRGWLYSLGVRSVSRQAGIGTALLEHAISELRNRGCPKVNLQVMPGNPAAVEFYRKRGFNAEERVSMGMVLQ